MQHRNTSYYILESNSCLFCSYSSCEIKPLSSSFFNSTILFASLCGTIACTFGCTVALISCTFFLRSSIFSSALLTNSSALTMQQNLIIPDEVAIRTVFPDNAVSTKPLTIEMLEISSKGSFISFEPDNVLSFPSTVLSVRASEQPVALLWVITNENASGTNKIMPNSPIALDPLSKIPFGTIKE